MKLPVASHTFLNDWDNCPHKAARKYIIKDLPRQPETTQMKWGNEVHKAFELYLNEGKAFPVGMEKFEPIAAPLRAAGARGELSLGIKEDGSPCDFWDKSAWLRGKLDAVKTNGSTIAAIMDFKTGKKREDAGELQTHAVLLKAHYPTVKVIVGRYVWLQEHEVGRPHLVSNTEDKLADIRSTMNIVSNSIATGFFPKRQNPLCGWCDVLDCEFNRKKEREARG